MRDVYINLDYFSIDKPFSLTERDYDGIEVDYSTIARLDEYNATLLNEECGIHFKTKIDWEEYYNKMDVLIAEKALKKAKEKLK